MSDEHQYDFEDAMDDIRANVDDPQGCADDMLGALGFHGEEAAHYNPFQPTPIIKDHYDPSQECQFDPYGNETDSTKLTVDWALKNRFVGPLIKEVFGEGHSDEHHKMMHVPYEPHLLISATSM